MDGLAADTEGLNEGEAAEIEVDRLIDGLAALIEVLKLVEVEADMLGDSLISLEAETLIDGLKSLIEGLTDIDSLIDALIEELMLGDSLIEALGDSLIDALIDGDSLNETLGLKLGDRENGGEAESEGITDGSGEKMYGPRSLDLIRPLCPRLYKIPALTRTSSTETRWCLWIITEPVYAGSISDLGSAVSGSISST